MGRFFGAEGRIVLTGLGGLAIGSTNLYARWKRIVVLLAGPFAQLIFAALVWLCYLILRPHFQSPAPGGFSIPQVFTILIVINVAWPAFNLLPFPPLDGGRIAVEFYRAMTEPKRPPWEQDPDWWKRR
jgi:membrane-associated protease RseP (regulator of RpoE activity)